MSDLGVWVAHSNQRDFSNILRSRIIKQYNKGLYYSFSGSHRKVSYAT